MNSESKSDENEPKEVIVGTEVLTKSFEAMWYQAEVLHKRTQDKIDSLEKRLNDLEAKREEVVKDRIMMFSQDIIATMKEMRAVEQDRLNLLFSILTKNSGEITDEDVQEEPQNPVNVAEGLDSGLA